MANALFCQVKCIATCGSICLADTVSPIGDVMGAVTGEGSFMNG